MPAFAPAAFFALTFLLVAAPACALTLTSPDIEPGGRIAEEQAFDGAECPGRNISPALIWSGVPEGTKSFAVSMIDPDAPAAGGFWHWWVYDLPVGSTGLKKGAGSGHGLPAGATQGRNDFGLVGYGGPCPPRGKPHHYVITVYALDADRFRLAAGASTADFDAAVRDHALAKATIVGFFSR
jgi:Raf kinase inhibitor-like YbhB/YbcL family protein